MFYQFAYNLLVLNFRQKKAQNIIVIQKTLTLRLQTNPK